MKTSKFTTDYFRTLLSESWVGWAVFAFGIASVFAAVIGLAVVTTTKVGHEGDKIYESTVTIDGKDYLIPITARPPQKTKSTEKP